MTLTEAKVKLISQLREQNKGLLTPQKEPRWGDWILDPIKQGPSTLNYREIALTDQQTGGLHKNTRELVNKLAEQPGDLAGFKPFFDSQTQPRQHNFPENTLVHARITDRPVEINGVDHENVLYAEEFQSDWAQSAIGTGTLRPEDISRKAELVAVLAQAKALVDQGMSIKDAYREIFAEDKIDELEELDRKQAYTPFLESGDKKGSVDQSPVISLAIRRILKEAVDNGQDYVVFANYNDQVTRWGPDEERGGKLRPIYQETTPNLIKKIVKNLGGYVKPTYKTKVDALIIEKTRKLNAARAEREFLMSQHKSMPDIRSERELRLNENLNTDVADNTNLIATLERELSPLKTEQTRLRVPLKEKESRYYKQHPDEVGKEEDAFFADTYLHPETKRGRPVADFVMDMLVKKLGGDLSDADIAREIKSWYSGAGNTVNALLSDIPILEPSSDNVWATIKDRDSPKRFVVHITEGMAKKIREEGQPVLSRAAGGPIIKGAVKTLTKPKKAPSLPSETLLATRPVEPLVPTPKMKFKASGKEPVYRVDIPSREWLHDKQSYARSIEANKWGAPHYGTVTGAFRVAPLSHNKGATPIIPLAMLDNVKGVMGEQDRTPDETKLSRIKEGIKEGVEFEAPFITVDQYGDAYISEGNHRITAARELGLKEIPVELRYFEGGELVDGPWHPEKVLGRSLDERDQGVAFHHESGPGEYVSLKKNQWPTKQQLLEKQSEEDRDEFNWNLYHGTRDDIREFNLDHPNRKDTGWLGTGVYGDTDPRLASEYSHLKSGYGDPNVMPLKARLTNPYHATMADKERLMLISIIEGAEAGREAADAWTAELKQKGHDGVILSSGNEGHSEVVVFDPANIRSKFAKFDPTKKGSADILAAAGGGVSSLNGIARNMTRYAYGGGVGSMNETARSM
jgi:hypothetical protein